MAYKRKWGGAGAYARTMGLPAVPFKRRRYQRNAAVSAPRRLPKNYRSRTATNTRTRRKKKRVKFHGSGQNGSMSSTQIGSNRWKTTGIGGFAKKVLNVQARAVSTGTSIGSSVGKQQVAVFTLNSAAELIALRTAANGGIDTLNDLKLYMYNNRNRMHIRSAHNSLVTLTIYDVVTKPARFGTIGSSFDQPAEAWEKGLMDTGLAAGHSLNVNQTPSFSPEFRRHYTIVATNKVLLEPGQQHEHTVYHKLNRQLDTTDFATSGIQSVPGITSHVMLVWHGSLEHETATPTTVTYTAATLDLVQFTEAKWGYVKGEALRTYTLVNNLATTIVDGDFMGEDQDADISPINA